MDSLAHAWLNDSTDALRPEIEALLEDYKRLVMFKPDRRNTKRSYRAVGEVRIGTGSRGQRLFLHVRFHSRRGSRIEIILATPKDEVIRHFHDHPVVHTNPDGTAIDGPHKHFPTKKFPINSLQHSGLSTWAYPVSDIDLEDPRKALEDFAKECGIFEFSRHLRGVW